MGGKSSNSTLDMSVISELIFKAIFCGLGDPDMPTVFAAVYNQARRFRPLAKNNT